jgi:hypothetical protein
MLAGVAALDAWLRDSPAAVLEPVSGLPPLLLRLRRSTGSAADLRQVAARLVDLRRVSSLSFPSGTGGRPWAGWVLWAVVRSRGHVARAA